MGCCALAAARTLLGLDLTSFEVNLSAKASLSHWLAWVVRIASQSSISVISNRIFFFQDTDHLNFVPGLSLRYKASRASCAFSSGVAGSPGGTSAGDGLLLFQIVRDPEGDRRRYQPGRYSAVLLLLFSEPPGLGGIRCSELLFLRGLSESKLECLRDLSCASSARIFERYASAPRHQKDLGAIEWRRVEHASGGRCIGENQL
jgi:hypothetical protein